MEMRGFKNLHQEFEALGARVAGISADTFAALGAFGEQLGAEFPLLSDWPEGKTIEAFGVRREGSPAPVAMRATFIFDADGTLRQVIDDQRDMNVHSEGALAAVREIAGES